MIDEFGMVGCSLLAEVSMKLHDVIVDVNPRKRNMHGYAQLFGDLNVLISGDLMQLACPHEEYLVVGHSPTTTENV